MNSMFHALQRLMAAIVLITLTSFLSGCASKPQVDWTARMGVFTYDQAVTELGPPSKQAKLSDGKTVAEWVMYRQPRSSFSVGVGGYGGHGGVGMGQTIGGGFQDRILRLTFGVDGKLENWSKNY